MRHDYQVSTKDMQRIRAERYREGFKITRNMANPEEAYKNLSFITDVGIVLSMQDLSIST